MKTLLLALCVLFAATPGAQAQNMVHTYDFRGTFNEASNAGPALLPLGTGRFKTDTLTDYNGLQRTVYQFDLNSGFYLNDSLQQFLASGSYTIELYFKMNELTSWKRVIDFKNRTSDLGCYVLSGQLNFYNMATSQGAPFVVNEYSQYVISRNAANSRVQLYGDGSKYITFTDNGNNAIYNATKKRINFFQDDLIVPNEASAGSIAMLRIYNYELDSQSVKSNYNGLNQSLGVRPVFAGAGQVTLHPNPATASLQVTLPENRTTRLQICDLMGHVLYDQTVDQSKATCDISPLAAGNYFLLATDESGGRLTLRFTKQ
ncbi:MAG: T9SS type A sorting domain-containing protein [Sphingobacteriales bacterium]|nr:MAG: T9SS type A sorting domain-containing protein [Sphingobacteriales bacterium]